jgi:hypothetical protein
MLRLDEAVVVAESEALGVGQGLLELRGELVEAYGRMGDGIGRMTKK